MSSLSFGLNNAKKKFPLTSRPVIRKPAFGGDEDENVEDGGNATNNAEEIGTIGGIEVPKRVTLEGLKSKKSGLKEPPRGKPKSNNTISLYGDLSSRTSSLKHASEAESLDPSVYDYDKAYDSMKSVERAKKGKEEADLAERKPKYMESLLAAAEVRKHDQLRAKEKMLQRDREAEGDEFADKEKFVTGAYKEQQAEMARLEEEEARKEEEELKRRAGMGMSGFYRGVLERDEKRHEELIAAAEQAENTLSTQPQNDDSPHTPKTAEDLARTLNSKNPQAIILNDDGLVVDKRQLLSAGLNVAPKKPPPSASSTPQHKKPTYATAKPNALNADRQSRRERQTQMLAQQLEQMTKRAADDEQDREREVERMARTKKSEKEIMGARERYLQRKREREAGGEGG
jgi:coiled-coil domain-containing protein 55